MKRKQKSTIAVLLSVIMAAGISGCASNQKPDASSTVNNESTEKGAGSESRASSESSKKITLKIWDIYTSDADANKANFEAVIKEWNDSNPNVQIDAEATENEAYKTKLKTAISANEAPDIFFSWGAGFSQPFVDAGKVMPLDDYLNDGTKDKLINGALVYLSYDNKVYGLPFTTGVGTFFVNKEMFDENGIKIPENFEELLAAVKSFRSKGITPMSVGEKDQWPGMFYYDILALREGGAKLNNDALSKKASYEDESFVKAADKLKQLVDAGAFDSACLGLTRDESEVPFIQGQIPMYYNGNWVAGSIEKDGSPTKGKVIAMNFPVISDGKGDKDEILGGAVDCFMVSSNTQYKEEAAKAVKYITESLSKKSYETGLGIPTWKVNVDESLLTPLTKQISEIASKSTGNVVWWDTYLDGASADTHKNLVAEIFGNQITPEDFAKQMQAINQNN